MECQNLIKEARAAMNMARAPYSKFKVGAAILTASGKIVRGCNIEFASYESVCAEKTAMAKAWVEGEHELAAIAVVSSSGEYTFPCGSCRQALVELMPEGKVIVVDNAEQVKIFAVKELLPYNFILPEEDHAIE